MESLEDRVAALQKQVRRYRVLNRTITILVALVLVGCAAYVISNLMSLQAHVDAAAASGIVRARRLEILDVAATRPVCVIRADDGGGRVEVFSRDGAALAGFDGNSGLIVRSTDAARFPETRPR